MEAKLCSMPSPFSSLMLAIPPKKKHMPITSKTLERMDPIMDDLTTSYSSAWRAIMLTYAINQISVHSVARIEREEWGQPYNQLDGVSKCSIEQASK